MAFIYIICFDEMKKIKVLYTIPNFDTAGSGKALLHLARGLNPDQFEVEIMCLHNKGELFKTVEDSGFTIHIHDFLPKERPIVKMLLECFKLSKIFKKIRPDIIHSFHYSSNYTEPLAAKIAGISWVFTKKNMSWGGSSRNSWRFRSWLSKKIVVQNRKMIQQFYPGSNKIKLIPRGISIEQFKLATKDSSLSTNFTNNPHTRIMICVANLVPVKGVEIAIQAFKEIYKQFDDWEFWIVGACENQYGESLINYVNENKLDHKIKFMGKQNSVKEFLDISELFVLPTLDKGEGSPVALLEAMANSKVVLGSNVPGISDQLENFKDHLFEAGNSLELSRKLSYWMSRDKKILNEKGALFFQHVQNNYSIQKEVISHQDLYLGIIKKS